MASCRFEIINQGHAVVPRSCAICGIGQCAKGLPDPYKQQAQGAAESTARPQSTFKVGDVVRLRSGGPQMVISCIIDRDDAPRILRAVWFGNGNELMADDFLDIVLVWGEP